MNPFIDMLRERFPKIAEMEGLKQFEWFFMRRVLGKPRRFSAAFIKTELEALNHQRRLVRNLQQGYQPQVRRSASYGFVAPPVFKRFS